MTNVIKILSVTSTFRHVWIQCIQASENFIVHHLLTELQTETEQDVQTHIQTCFIIVIRFISYGIDAFIMSLCEGQ